MVTAIFDMDGTLADVRPIRHYVEGERRDFGSFHRASRWVAPNETVAAIARWIASFGTVLVVTARDERYERETVDWLIKHSVPYTRLYMRGWGDGRKDAVVKREILARIRADGFEPTVAVDDNPAVIEVWASEGLGVVTVPGWGA